MLRQQVYCLFVVMVCAIKYEAVSESDPPDLSIVDEFFQNRLSDDEWRFSIPYIINHATYESRAANPPRIPMLRTVELFDPTTGRLHEIEFPSLSDQVTEILDTRTDFTAMFEMSLREAAWSFEIQGSVNTDAQGYRALTSFTLPNLPGDLKQLWEEPQQELTPHSPISTSSRLFAPFLSITPRSSRYIDIMCVNLWNYNHWEKRKDVLAKEIKERDPDVIGFQEVRARKVSYHTHSRFQIDDLVRMLGPGYQFVYRPVMEFAESSEEYVHEGLAIFSKFPILNTSFLLLSRDEKDNDDFHQRMILSCLLSTSLGPVQFMTTHLSLSAKARKRTLPEVGNWMKDVKYPVVLLGDFNAEFKEENPLSQFGFQDAWALKHPDDLGWTFNSWEPKSRIDYIMVKNVDVDSISIVGKEGTPWPSHLDAVGGVKDMKRTLFPSDHMLLSARLIPHSSSPKSSVKIDL